MAKDRKKGKGGLGKGDKEDADESGMIGTETSARSDNPPRSDQSAVKDNVKGGKKKRGNKSDHEDDTVLVSKPLGSNVLPDERPSADQKNPPANKGAVSGRKRASAGKKGRNDLSDSDDGMDLMKSALEEEVKKEDAAPTKKQMAFKKKKDTSKKKGAAIHSGPDDGGQDLMQQEMDEIEGGENQDSGEEPATTVPDKKPKDSKSKSRRGTGVPDEAENEAGGQAQVATPEKKKKKDASKKKKAVARFDSDDEGPDLMQQAMDEIEEGEAQASASRQDSGEEPATVVPDKKLKGSKSKSRGDMGVPDETEKEADGQAQVATPEKKKKKDASKKKKAVARFDSDDEGPDLMQQAMDEIEEGEAQASASQQDSSKGPVTFGSDKGSKSSRSRSPAEAGASEEAEMKAGEQTQMLFGKNVASPKSKLRKVIRGLDESAAASPEEDNAVATSSHGTISPDTMAKPVPDIVASVFGKKKKGYLKSRHKIDSGLANQSTYSSLDLPSAVNIGEHEAASSKGRGINDKEPVAEMPLDVDQLETMENTGAKSSTARISGEFESSPQADAPAASDAGGDASASKKRHKTSRVLEKRIKKAATTSAKAEIKRKNATNQKSSQDDIEGPDDEQELRTMLSKAHFGFASGYLPGEFGANPTESVSTTGILTTPPGKMDIHIKSLSLQAHGKHLINDTELILNVGRRYGLIAPNGSGKSTLLTALACGLLPMPSALSVYMLDREFKMSEMSSLEAVAEIVKSELEYLMKEEERYALRQDEYPEIFNYIQTRIQELEARNTELSARRILMGLGFSEDLISRKTKDLSGGWRMRVSLARILFAKPMLMLLDEPTNHLDLESVVWLEDYLVNETEGCTLVITSHSQDTLNEVCSDIVQIYNKTLQFYTGNYDTFCKVRAEREALIIKKAEALKKKMSKIQESLGTSGTRRVQAMQRAKNIQKAKDKSDAQDKTANDEIVYTKDLVIRFEDCGGGLPSPALKVIDVCFGYESGNLLFENLNFGIDLKSRIALVGVNGSGKSTLMALMLSEIAPTSGHVVKHHNLRCARFSQNLADQLDYEMSPVSWLRSHFKEYREQDMRRFLGRYGLTGKTQVIKIRNLSDGQRRRVLFAYIGLRNPHILFMDEPTNALDIETIDVLADAINNFDGGVVMISHDFRLLDQVADTVWIIKDKNVRVYDGEIRDYKADIKNECIKKRMEHEAGTQTGKT